MTANAIWPYDYVTGVGEGIFRRLGCLEGQGATGRAIGLVFVTF